MEPLKWEEKKPRSGFVVTPETTVNGQIKNILANVRLGTVTSFEATRRIKSLKEEDDLLLNSYTKFLSGEMPLSAIMRDINLSCILLSLENHDEKGVDSSLPEAKKILESAKLDMEASYKELQTSLRFHDAVGFILDEVARRNLSVESAYNILKQGGEKFVRVDKLTGSGERADKVDERLKESKICYPSRDCPKSIEICYSDMDCLASEAFLTSTIIDFYIRFLQQPTSTDRASCDYHIFNTYFYNKLEDVVLNKNASESLFVKFRSWWKDVALFQKAYVLVPIHENHHWSLLIICFPGKEDDVGPILLHLDSLGFHLSRPIFKNIKSFLREEWKCLKQGEAPPDLPIADRIWKNLPRTIVEKTLEVPQQRNAYDCGLFVLFFIERFIDEAPERLKKEDLAMFGKKWFKPEEASNLRGKIQKLLLEEFQSVLKEK